MSGEVVDVAITGIAVGGDGVGRDPSGRAVFVAGAVPGDVATVSVRSSRPRFAHGDLVSLRAASPDRVEPGCPHVARGCGGCALQQLTVEAQRRHKLTMVADALARLGRIVDPLVQHGPALATAGFRTTLRLAVVEGRAGFRRERSHDVTTVDSCDVAHPMLAELLATGSFGPATEVVLRAGARTGERLVLVDGPLAAVALPDDVVVAATAPVGQGGPAGAPGRRPRPSSEPGPAYHEIVAGRRWRISAPSFFQTRADGADVLVSTVAAELGAAGFEPGTLLDAYCGVGLLSAAAPGATIIGVEANPSAVADAAFNLADRDARLVCQPFERWSPTLVDAVVADPARRGLGAAGVANVAATGAAVVVLVSCDAASLGRDAGLLAAAGYRFERSTLLDFFPFTGHVEVVSGFTRTAGAARVTGSGGVPGR